MGSQASFKLLPVKGAVMTAGLGNAQSDCLGGALFCTSAEYVCELRCVLRRRPHLLPVLRAIRGNWREVKAKLRAWRSIGGGRDDTFFFLGVFHIFTAKISFSPGPPLFIPISVTAALTKP